MNVHKNITVYLTLSSYQKNIIKYVLDECNSYEKYTFVDHFKILN